MAAKTRQFGTRGTGSGKAKVPRTEVLWINQQSQVPLFWGLTE